LQPEPKINPNSVGCPYCTAGHAPSWRYIPLPGEWVHVIHEKVGERSSKVTIAACTAAERVQK
jgi:hypothetical protein